MRTTLTRTFQALCALTVVALLSACGGATSTVDPFQPTRVIGLGDGYNDVGSDANAPYTVRGIADTAGVSNARTVVEQLAYYFGFSTTYTATFVNAGTYANNQLPATGTFSYAYAGAQVSNGNNSLKDQVDRLLDDVGTFTDKDLVFIAIGTEDIKAGTTASAAVADLKTQIQRLFTAKATHVLLMQPLELTNTPWGRGNATYTGKTQAFIDEELTALPDLNHQPGALHNPLIFTNTTTLSSDFNIYTTYSSGAYGEFSTSTQVPYCATSLTDTTFQGLVGCAVTDGFNDATYSTRLFADGLHLTPAGNRWVATRVYNATAAGWR